ncbi:exonuclease V [Mixophyes fleayi]|uniref:exonuclease V n=1 Tax=Mixophyes fleayi TaxID=3061075 RepID=UPI003F4D9284
MVTDADSETAAASAAPDGGDCVAGLDDRTACEDNDRDGFSDISDSELVLLQNKAESGDTYIKEKKDIEMEHGITSLGKIDKNGEVAESLQQYGAGENCPLENVQRKRKQRAEAPLEKYHLKYLSVTDVCSQTWCEQQMVYKTEQPVHEQPEKTAAMNEGSSIHLARELEVHDVVSVTTQTREDSWAIKFLNILAMIPVLQSGGRIREFPVFGELDGICLVGVIDELGYSSKGELELRELKTRVSPTLPRSAQKKGHKFQVSLYKLLFDDMVSGALQPDVFIEHLKLRPEQELGPQVKEHAFKSGLTVSTLRDILELTCLNLTFSDLPTIDSLKLEYCYQGDGSLLGYDVVTFEKECVMEQVRFYLSYWKGLREVQGVDIEDAWKCRMCDYANICEWRTQKAKNMHLRTQSKKLE